MKLKNIIKFLEPFNDVVIHVHYRELDNSISCDEYAYEGFIENIPWTMLEYELYNDSKYAIYGISARNYGEEKDMRKAGFIINLLETDY